MKREFTPKGPPFSAEELEALVAAAPAYVYDPDSSYDPSNEAEVEAFWSRTTRSKIPSSPAPTPKKLPAK